MKLTHPDIPFSAQELWDLTHPEDIGIDIGAVFQAAQDEEREVRANPVAMCLKCRSAVVFATERAWACTGCNRTNAGDALNA